MNHAPDKYQSRYAAHQKRKRRTLIRILRHRHSTREFSEKEMPFDISMFILRACVCAPSSCNRKGVRPQFEVLRDRKNLLGGLLVGGAGWIHRAPLVILLFGDRTAYKAGDEINYMPFLDAGVMAQTIMLALDGLGLKTCFVNPNVREPFRGYMDQEFARGRLLCGAIAVGYPTQEEVAAGRCYR